jgi:hypothetical protein
MKFNIAWSQVISQNLILRLALFSESIVIIGLLVATIKASLKEPLIIERGCFSQAVEKSNPDRGELEIKTFLKEALHQRFDSDGAVQDGFLSKEESNFREEEQKELLSKEIKQRLILNQVIKINGNEVTVDSDRLISVGTVRSAFPFPLILIISTVNRSQGNPYGLKLMQVKPLQNEKKDGK